MSGRPLFGEEFLRKLEYLRLVSRQLQPGAFKGEHRSRKRGSGIEFADYRPYVDGDDVHDVDWPAYLRSNKLLIRLFEEEGDLPIYILLDASKSMGEGDARKFDYGRKTAGALAYIGLLNLDRVIIATYREDISDTLPALRGPHRAFTAFRFLQRLEPGGGTNLAQAVRTFFAPQRRRGLVVVISDFFDPEGHKSLDRLRYLGHDLLAIEVSSQTDHERELTPEVVVVDAESGQQQRLAVDPTLLDELSNLREEHSEELKNFCHSRGWGYLSATVEVPFEDLILGAFRQGRFLR